MEEQTVNNQVHRPNIPTPPEPKHNSFLTNKLFLITLAVIIFILLLVIGGNYMRNLQLQEQMFPPSPEPPLPPSITIEPSSITDETANWKTFTNTKFGFSVEYPPDWKIEESTPIKPDIVIYSSDNSSNLIIAPIYEARYAADRDRNKKLAKSPTTLFSGRSAREYRENFEDEFERVFVRDIQVEDISGLNWTKPNEISYWVDTSQPELIKIFDQILSTFKFTDKEEQVVCTQDVKTCPDGSYVSRQPPNCEFAACP